MTRLLLIISLLLFGANVYAIEFTDDFNRADNTDIGTNWTPVTSEDAANLVGNRIRTTTVGGSLASTEYVNSISPTNDQFAQVTIASLSGASHKYGGPILRAATGARTYYACAVNANTSKTDVYKIVAGTYTSIASETATTWAAGDKVFYTVRATSLFCFRNGSLLVSGTDSAITSGNVGVTVESDTGGALGDIELDDFVGGDIRKTRFYFPTGTTCVDSPGFGAYSDTSEGIRRTMVTTKGATAIADGQTVDGSNTANTTDLDEQRCSAAINSQDIMGVAYGQLMVRELASTDDLDRVPIRLAVYGGTTLRCTLMALGHVGTQSEFNSTNRNKKNADGDAITFCAAGSITAGDRIVLEIGYQVDSTGGTTPQGVARWGENATDCPEDDTTTTDCAGWFEIIGTTVSFQTSGGAVPIGMMGVGS